jgi:hypothetical protein
MKRTNDNTPIAELFLKAGLVAAIAAALLAPTKVRADDKHPLNAPHAPMLKRASWNDLPLPPIPYLETMPWLNAEWLGRDRAETPTKIDTLLAPKFELIGPAVVESGGSARLSSTPDLAGKG